MTHDEHYSLLVEEMGTAALFLIMARDQLRDQGAYADELASKIDAFLTQRLEVRRKDPVSTSARSGKDDAT